MVGLGLNVGLKKLLQPFHFLDQPKSVSKPIVNANSISNGKIASFSRRQSQSPSYGLVAELGGGGGRRWWRKRYNYISKPRRLSHEGLTNERRSEAKPEPGHKLDPEDARTHPPALPHRLFLQRRFPAPPAPTPVRPSSLSSKTLNSFTSLCEQRVRNRIGFCRNSLVSELDNMTKLAEECDIQVPMNVLK